MEDRGTEGGRGRKRKGGRTKEGGAGEEEGHVREMMKVVRGRIKNCQLHYPYIDAGRLLSGRRGTVTEKFNFSSPNLK